MSVPPNKPSHKWALLSDLRHGEARQVGRPAGDAYERMLWRVVQKTWPTAGPGSCCAARSGSRMRTRWTRCAESEIEKKS
jgi:hypothetical protein